MNHFRLSSNRLAPSKLHRQDFAYRRQGISYSLGEFLLKVLSLQDIPCSRVDAAGDAAMTIYHLRRYLLPWSPMGYVYEAT